MEGVTDRLVGVAYSGDGGPGQEVVADLDADVWQVLPVGAPGGAYDERDQGSNVDLEEYTDIDAELANVPRMQDAALKQYSAAEKGLPELRYQMRQRWADALGKAVRAGGAATVIKATAELTVRDLRFKIETAEMESAVALQVLKVYEQRLSAAQTRARKWIAQYDRDVKGGPR